MNTDVHKLMDKTQTYTGTDRLAVTRRHTIGHGETHDHRNKHIYGNIPPVTETDADSN
jgi:hypothetical protein